MSRIVREDVDNAAKELAASTGLDVRIVPDDSEKGLTIVRIAYHHPDDGVTYLHTCIGTRRKVFDELSAAWQVHRLCEIMRCRRETVAA